MEIVGINWSFLIIQVVNFLIISGWPLLSLIALFKLRQSPVTETHRILWALLVIAIPFLGALAFFMLRSGAGHPSKVEGDEHSAH